MFIKERSIKHIIIKYCIKKKEKKKRISTAQNRVRGDYSKCIHAHMHIIIGTGTSE